MKEKENGQTDPEERVYKVVKTFHENEGLKTVEKHLMDVITATDEWINWCPKVEIADRVRTLCNLLQLVEKLEECLNTGKIEPDNDINN